MTERSRDRDVSSLSFAEDSTLVSTITNVPLSIDVPVMPQPPATEVSEQQSSVDPESRIALKIVQERLAHHRATENEEKTSIESPSRETISKAGPASSAFITATGTAEESTAETQQQQSQQQLAPGAVRVAGMNSNITESFVSHETTAVSQKSSTATPFEPEVPVEAKLVNDDSSKNDLYVEAQPVDASQLKLMDVFKNPKICGALVALILSITSLVVGLSVGITRRNNPVPPDANTTNSTPVEPPLPPNNTNITFIQATIQAPFSDKLLDISIEIIVSDATSPQTLANTWMWADPNRETYSVDRSLTRYGLATLFFATDGWNWTKNDSWLSYETHECHWYMSGPPNTTCNEDDQHVNVNLTSNALNGTATIRELLLYLRQVHTLDVSNNSLYGEPPPLQAERPGLTHLDYSRNLLKGRISAEFGWQNSHLQVLRVEENHLSGSIPAALYSMFPMAEEINLSGNEFTGNFPGRILQNNTYLKILNLENNQLQGRIPSSLHYLRELEALDISGNEDITGTIPNSLSACTDLKVLDIEDTSVSGSVPAGLCQKQYSQQLEVKADCDEVECC